MILPLSCTTEYISTFLRKEYALTIYNHLKDAYNIQEAFLEMKFSNSKYTSDFGKISFTDEENIKNNRFPVDSYGKIFAWDKIMSPLKLQVEKYTKTQFGMCVCIYYPDGNSGIGFHSDYRAFGDLDLIPSISLGAERGFVLRNKGSLEEYSIKLENGSILLMGEGCQEKYEHSLPVDSSCLHPRINLTFRKVDNNYKH